ncbi:MAG: YihY/virulence factor BrkB family protein [Planctomycetes bacterium]|nr:YihY/virulence factor BrkB family protein [Planctomycetota bacterium]
MAWRFRAVVDRLARVMTQPLDELSRFQRTLRFLYDLGRHGARQLQHDRAPQMAGALAFRTLFALLPVMVLGTMLIRALGGFEDLESKLADLFTRLGLDQFQMVTVAAENETSVASGESVSQWLLGLLDQVQQINVAAIGWVGLAVVIYSAIALMVTIEKSFNIIYRAPEGRSWSKRLTIYWTVLTLGPGAIIAAMYVGNWLDGFFTQQGGWWSIFRAAPVIWNYLALWLVTFAIYKLIPNTNVTYRPALFGALLAAVLLELGKRTLGAYFVNAVSFGQLYGSLGLIPVFMFWVYVMWLIVLFGLEVSATLQMLGGRRLEEFQAIDRTGLVDPTSVLLVMQVVARHFDSSHPTSARQVADEISIAESTVLTMFEHLVADGILHRLDREDGSVAMARPPDQVSADEILEIGYRMCDESEASRSSVIIQRLRDAQKSLAGQTTLAKLAAHTDQAVGS